MITADLSIILTVILLNRETMESCTCPATASASTPQLLLLLLLLLHHQLRSPFGTSTACHRTLTITQSRNTIQFFNRTTEQKTKKNDLIAEDTERKKKKGKSAVARDE